MWVELEHWCSFFFLWQIRVQEYFLGKATEKSQLSETGQFVRNISRFWGQKDVYEINMAGSHQYIQIVTLECNDWDSAITRNELYFSADKSEEESPKSSAEAEVSTSSKESSKTPRAICFSTANLARCNPPSPGADEEHWRSADGLLPHGDGQRHTVHAAAESGPRHHRAVRLPPGGQARDPVGGRGHHLRVRGGGAHPAALLTPQVQVGRRRASSLLPPVDGFKKKK